MDVKFSATVHKPPRGLRRGWYAGPDAGSPRKTSIFQNASLLSQSWRNLSNKHYSQDPFYVLTAIFNFVIAAECEFLVMMRIILEQELERSIESKEKSLIVHDLEYNRQCLDRHIRQMKHLMEFIDSREDSGWPGAGAVGSLEHREIDRGRRLLKKDLEVLLSDAFILSADFKTGMSPLMNSAMTDESQRAVAQAERTAQLTALAFFFIPLSFTSSFFGMNFKEFEDRDGHNKLSVWAWAITSAVVMLVAYCFHTSGSIMDLGRKLVYWCYDRRVRKKP